MGQMKLLAFAKGNAKSFPPLLHAADCILKIFCSPGFCTHIRHPVLLSIQLLHGYWISCILFSHQHCFQQAVLASILAVGLARASSSFGQASASEAFPLSHSQLPVTSRSK